MNNARRFCLTALCSLGLVAAAVAVPASRHQAAPSKSAAQTQSVSGKIASVEQSSFTLTVSSSSSQISKATPGSKTMTFQIDKNTTVEGTLKVNALADVTYRE